MEDESGQIQALGRTDLHEAGSIDDDQIHRICSRDSRGERDDIEHGYRHTTMIELVVFATIFTVIVLLTGGPGNTL